MEKRWKAWLHQREKGNEQNMSNIAIVYWSGTGNTAAMAEAVAEGVSSKGAAVNVCQVSDFDASMLPTLDAVAFGCPAMGAEELEDSEFAPVFDACKDKLAGKKVALFGSYGWGTGEWMQTWEEQCAACGIALCADSVICCEAPDDTALTACRKLGSALV